MGHHGVREQHGCCRGGSSTRIRAAMCSSAMSFWKLPDGILKTRSGHTCMRPGCAGREQGRAGGRAGTHRPGWASKPVAEALATASAPRSAALFILCMHSSKRNRVSSSRKHFVGLVVRGLPRAILMIMVP